MPENKPPQPSMLLAARIAQSFRAAASADKTRPMYQRQFLFLQGHLFFLALKNDRNRAANRIPAIQAFLNKASNEKKLIDLLLGKDDQRIIGVKPILNPALYALEQERENPFVQKIALTARLFEEELNKAPLDNTGTLAPLNMVNPFIRLQMAALVFLHLYNLQKDSLALDGSLQSLAKAPSFYESDVARYNPTDHPINQSQNDVFRCVKSLETLEGLIRETSKGCIESNDPNICLSVKSGVYMLSNYLAPFRMENVRPISDERLGEVVKFPTGHSATLRESMGPSV